MFQLTKITINLKSAVNQTLRLKCTVFSKHFQLCNRSLISPSCSEQYCPESFSHAPLSTLSEMTSATPRTTPTKKLYFTVEFRNCLDWFSALLVAELAQATKVMPAFQIKIRKISRLHSPKKRRTELENEMKKKYSKIYNARAQPLFCLLPFSLPSRFA